MPNLPDPTQLSRRPYGQLGLFSTLGATRENRELLNANLRSIEDRLGGLWSAGSGLSFTYEFHLDDTPPPSPAAGEMYAYGGIQTFASLNSWAWSFTDYNGVDRQTLFESISYGVGDLMVVESLDDPPKAIIATVQMYLTAGGIVDITLQNGNRSITGELFSEGELVRASLLKV